MNADALIDAAVWEKWRRFGKNENAPDFFLSLLDALLNGLPQNLSAFDAAIQANDVKVLCHLAHTMKTSFRSLGAMALGDLLEEIEVRAKACGVADPAVIARVRGALPDVARQMTAERDRLRPRSGA